MKKKVMSFIIVALISVIAFSGCGKEVISYDVAEEDVPSIDGYTLLWHDEFNGDTLDTSIWGKEVHKPGWVNNELQSYTSSDENIFIKDGNLVIKALKTVDENGKESYTSGRIRTRYKKEFTYGRVEVRAKVPKGRGLWPAAWLMPASDEKYGQWPLGGEIDIMEILGHETNKTYSTIHFGLPHSQSGNNYRTPVGEPDFSEEFHVFSVEWEPGEMRFYCDDQPVHTVNKWYTAYYRQVPAPFPAPFDSDFYVILNLAVGGDWPGKPNEYTDFDNAEYYVDYVRVYQKTE